LGTRAGNRAIEICVFGAGALCTTGLLQSLGN
jgi:hypothetical protein